MAYQNFLIMYCGLVYLFRYDIMPYTIEQTGKGFRVCDSSMKCFSKKGLPKATAQKQRIAIAISESQKTGKPIKSFFK
jgi:hypothetical protein